VVGQLAMLGYREFLVHRRPRVALVVTGNELVEPGQPLKPGQIYDSNSYALSAAIVALGLEPPQIHRALDTRESTRNAFHEALQEADVVISSGGVSVGDYDYVKVILEELGSRTIFWRVAIKPGKPVYFGVLDRTNVPDSRSKLVFGLPGNPVSVLVTYHQLVKPALCKMMGVTRAFHPTFEAMLAAPLNKKPGRLDFVRATARAGEGALVMAQPTRGQDSHMMSGLAKANSLIHFPADADHMDAGTIAKLDLLRWSD
ncbi:MAG: molybdopterin molybdotransferase MoeA, partial [Terriglobales bacterium]